MIDAPSPELLRRASSGDRQAQSELVEPWLAPVVRWSTRLCGPRVDPEDVAHEVLIVALTKLHTLREPSKFGSWLYGTTRKVIAQHRRRAWLSRWVGAPDEEPAGHSAGPEIDLTRRESSRRLLEILEKVPRKQREVLVLVCVEERSAPEVAALLDVPEGTVRSRLRAGKKRLLSLLEHSGFDPPGIAPNKHAGVNA